MWIKQKKYIRIGQVVNHRLYLPVGDKYVSLCVYYNHNRFHACVGDAINAIELKQKKLHACKSVNVLFENFV